MSDEESIIASDYHKSKFLNLSKKVIFCVWFIFAVIMVIFAISLFIIGDKMIEWIL